MYRRTMLKLGIAGAVTSAFGSTGIAQGKPVMRISHQVPPAHHLSKIIEGFVNDVKARVGDELDIQVFGSEQLVKAADNFPSVARGSLEAAISTNFQWGQTLPEMNAITIPYLFSDLGKIKKYPSSEARAFLDEKLAQRGVRSLSWFYITRLGIFTSGTKPIVALDDFKGLRIRGFNSLNDTGLRAVGAAPVAMPASEVYQALQSGVLDAGLTDLSAAVSRKFFEVQKFGTVSPHFAIYFHLYVNPRWFSALTANVQKALIEASAKAEIDALAITESTASAASAQLREKGMTIHYQTPQEVEIWKTAMQGPVIEAFLKSAPEGGAKIIDLINKL
jgi:TRAP-type C4-dicarboxylate transport system substrate-binding protein